MKARHPRNLVSARTNHLKQALDALHKMCSALAGWHASTLLAIQHKPNSDPLCEAVDNFLGARQSLPAHIIISPQALLAAIHQARIAQNAQVMRNGGLFQGEALNNLEDAYFPFVSTEQAQNTQTCRICQCLEQACLADRFIFCQRWDKFWNDANPSIGRCLPWMQHSRDCWNSSCPGRTHLIH